LPQVMRQLLCSSPVAASCCCMASHIASPVVPDSSCASVRTRLHIAAG
jgi:hypothetical protein